MQYAFLLVYILAGVGSIETKIQQVARIFIFCIWSLIYLRTFPISEEKL